MAKPLGFKDMINVDHRPGEDELIQYRAKRRRNGAMSEKAQTNKEEKIICPKCKGEGCDHCDGKGYHVSTDEALNVQQRMARKRLMKKLAPKIRIGRERAKRRMPDMNRFKKRAKKASRMFFFKKLSKGASKDTLPLQRRQEIEKRLDKPAFKTRIDRMAKRILKDVRKKEMERRKPKND